MGGVGACLADAVCFACASLVDARYFFRCGLLRRPFRHELTVEMVGIGVCMATTVCVASGSLVDGRCLCLEIRLDLMMGDCFRCCDCALFGICLFVVDVVK